VKVVKIQSEMTNGQLRTPTKIPQKIQMIKEEEAPPDLGGAGVVGGVPGGVPGGSSGGVIGGILGGAGGTLIYIMLLNVYTATLPGVLKATATQISSVAVSLAGIFAVGMFLVIAVLAAYNITGTIEGPHDPKFKRFPRDIIASAVAAAVCGVLAIMLVVV
jgi:tetrahydromethanopterin S-methyltransferase subunit D